MANDPFDSRRWIYESESEPKASSSRKRARFQEETTAISETRHPSGPPPPSASSIPLQAILYGLVIAILLFFSTFSHLSRLDAHSDDISPAVKAYVDRALNKALRDPVGRRDFALHADGGRVIPDLTAVAPFGARDPSDCFAPSTSRSDIIADADQAITDDVRIGHCWTISGQSAQLGLRLSELMHPTHVSIDHIPQEIAADIGRAPRGVALWGAVDGANIDKLSQDDLGPPLRTAPSHLHGRRGPVVTCGHTYALVASFEYDIRAGTHVQTHPVERYVMDLDLWFGVMVLEILDNWGSNSTCLYRVRVHGEPRAS